MVGICRHVEKPIDVSLQEKRTDLTIIPLCCCPHKLSLSSKKVQTIISMNYHNLSPLSYEPSKIVDEDTSAQRHRHLDVNLVTNRIKRAPYPFMVLRPFFTGMHPKKTSKKDVYAYVCEWGRFRDTQLTG